MARNLKTSLKATKHNATICELEEARISYEKAEGGHRNALDRAVLKGIEKAEVIQNDNDAWLQFKDNEKWSKRKAKPGSLLDALLYSLIWIFGSRQQASKIHRAIRPYYNKVDLSAAEIIKTVRNCGGYEKCARLFANERKPGATRTVCIEVPVMVVPESDACFPFECRITIVGRRGRLFLGSLIA